MARDASSAGDRVAAENYLQHAEHYFRIMAAQREDAEARAATQPQQRGGGGNGAGSGNGSGDRRGQGSETETTGYGTDGFDQPYDDPDDADEMPAFVRRKIVEPRSGGDQDSDNSDGDSESETAIGD